MSFKRNTPLHYENEDCPACNAYDKPKGGKLIEKRGQYGKYLGCNRFPKCKYTCPFAGVHERNKGTPRREKKR